MANVSIKVYFKSYHQLRCDPQERICFIFTELNDMASFVDSLIAPLGLINILTLTVGLKNKKNYKNPHCFGELLGGNITYFRTNGDNGHEKI